MSKTPRLVIKMRAIEAAKAADKVAIGPLSDADLAGWLSEATGHRLSPNTVKVMRNQGVLDWPRPFARGRNDERLVRLSKMSNIREMTNVEIARFVQKEFGWEVTPESARKWREKGWIPAKAKRFNYDYPEVLFPENGNGGSGDLRSDLGALRSEVKLLNNAVSRLTTENACLAAKVQALLTEFQS